MISPIRNPPELMTGIKNTILSKSSPLSGSLSNLEVDWMEDPHAGAVIKAFESLPTGRKITRGDVEKLLEGNFRVGCTALRLFLDFSKDEFTRITAELFKDCGGAGVTNFKKDPDAFVEKL